MNIDQWVPSKVLQILALDLGLLILAGWFFILLLIIREFRQFAQKVSSGQPDDSTLAMCQKALDDAMSFAQNNAETLNELIRVQQTLESQVTDIRESTQDHVSPEEKALISDLNQKLARSHKLIKKLKGDLDTSAKRLKRTKEKLFAQYDTVEKLRKEKKEVEQKYDRLEQEYQSVATASGNAKELEREHQIEKQNILAALSQYKRQVEEQEGIIRQMLDEGAQAGNSNVKDVQKELAAAQEQLRHMTKVKDFVEAKFLELLNKTEGKS